MHFSAFIESVFTGKRVSAAVESTTEESISLAVCFEPQALSCDETLLLSSAFIKMVMQHITNVIKEVKEHNKHWSSTETHKVCVLYSGPVCMHMQGSTAIVMM